MALQINKEVFCNGQIIEALGKIEQLGSRNKFGIKRWDNVLDTYPFSGTVVMPVKLGFRLFRDPFYFAIEKVNDKESIRVKPVKGDQWSMGDVYGFFGLHDFKDYVYGMPILIVEGYSDWAVWKKYYRYVLAAGSAWISRRQAYFLSGLTNNAFIGFDLDETGDTNKVKVKKMLNSEFGMNVAFVVPPKKDWGSMFEDEWACGMLEQIGVQFIDVVNEINKQIL